MPSFIDSADARQIKQTIDWHLANIANDTELTQRLEGVATQRAFNGMCWYWGPKLYARSRVAFRPFVLNHFGDAAPANVDLGLGSEPIAWSGAQAQVLEAWLEEVDRADDVPLFRRLYAWKRRSRRGWGIDAEPWAADLLKRFSAAQTPSRRARVLEKFDLGSSVQLDEACARKLYDVDRTLAGPFILKHLPHRGWRDNADKRWKDLIRHAEALGDRAFAMTLYRRHVPQDSWRDDALALVRRGMPQAELIPALEERHPEGLWSDLGPAYLALLEAGGEAVLPYVRKHLNDAGAWSFLGDSALSLARFAQARGWVDFGIAVLVKCARPKAWNRAIGDTLDDRSIDEPERLRRLALFSGVSREWNFLGWGLASVQQLEPALALKLYERYPRLAGTQFKAHLTPAWSESYQAVFERAWSTGDDEMADHLASRYLTRGMWGRPDAKELAPAERVADLLVALKLEPAAFARRAAAILTKVPAYAVRDYPGLIRHNRLARLLFERSMDDYLADAEGAAVRDLVEASEIHVQRLAYRVLGRSDVRARRLASDNLDILIGTLLRPLHRETRAQAFGALNNAAYEEAGARRVLAKAREAFALPDEGYPKEGLLDLVGKILARHPQLAEVGEARVVYRRAA